MDLARQYYQIARNWRDWYNSGFAPLEDKELNEVNADVKTEPHYDMAIGRSLALGKALLKNKGYEAIKCYSPYETGAIGEKLRDYAKLSGRVLSASMGLGYRNERNRLMIMEMRRWKRKEVVLARGRDMAGASVLYGSLAGKLFGSLANQAGAAAGGYFSFLGYSRERQKTLYPVQKTYIPEKYRQPSDPALKGQESQAAPEPEKKPEPSFWQSIIDFIGREPD
jgi:hypothetical protein